MDSFLIWFYRLTDTPILGYYLGTAVLCLICVVLGRLTLGISCKFNQKELEQYNRSMVRMHNLSLFALLARNKQAYKSCNKEANEAFGKVFFAQVALGSSSLWPVPFALAWMQSRFGQVSFELPLPLPLIGNSVGFMFTFFPIFVLVFMIFGRVYRWFLSFRPATNAADVREDNSERLLSLNELTSVSRVQA
jgi:hypothetical protein